MYPDICKTEFINPKINSQSNFICKVYFFRPHTEVYIDYQTSCNKTSEKCSGYKHFEKMRQGFCCTNGCRENKGLYTCACDLQDTVKAIK